MRKVIEGKKKRPEVKRDEERGKDEKKKDGQNVEE